jgi:hypothetical protein
MGGAFFLDGRGTLGRGSLEMLGRVWKRPNPLALKCDSNTSPRRLVHTFVQQMVPDLIK